jgi:hypothetical protein
VGAILGLSAIAPSPHRQSTGALLVAFGPSASNSACAEQSSLKPTGHRHNADDQQQRHQQQRRDKARIVPAIEVQGLALLGAFKRFAG